MRDFVKKYNKQILFCVIFAAAILIRVFKYCSHPAGMNQDEVSVGYDAWALMTHGIDRNGSTLPVHLIAWGSGQNALYAYLSMPFILIFGLNAFSVRLVNLIFGLLTIAVVYFTVKRFNGTKAGLIAMALTAAAPWHIMLSRWAMESNLFPAMLMLSVWAVLRSVDNQKFLLLGAALLSLSMYSYGSAYIIITLFGAICFVYFIVKKIVSIKILIASAGIFVVMSLPIYLFMLVNVLNLNEIKIGFITIPKLFGDRISDESGTTIVGFFKNLFSLLVFQTDSFERNALGFYGCLYVISLPFWIYGIIKCARRRSVFDFVMLAALLSSVVLFGFYKEPNINRVNAVYILLIVFAGVGLSDIVTDKTKLAAISLTYAVCLGAFTYSYFKLDYRRAIAKEFHSGFDKAIVKAEEIASDNDTVYVAADVHMAYIYTLFYTQTPPQEFVDTVVYENPGEEFRTVTSYCNYKFDTDALKKPQKGVYIVDNDDIDKVNALTDEVYQLDYFTVAVLK